MEHKRSDNWNCRESSNKPIRKRLCYKCSVKSGYLCLGRWIGDMQKCASCQRMVEEGDIIQIPMQRKVYIPKWKRNAVK